LRIWFGLELAVAVGAVCASAFGLESDEVVARAGEATLVRSAIETRIQRTPPAQLKGLGNPSESAAKRVVVHWMIPEMLSKLEAERRGLDKSPRAADRVREILRQALEKTVKKQVLTSDPVTPEQLKAYYEANRSRYDLPARIRIWRILVADEGAAKALLEEAKAANRPAKWSDLARDRSLDKATNLRQGDLGFVRPDGTTDVPRVVVDPALFKAAEQVKDGEFVADPVPEGDQFAVIWRRGSIAASKRTLDGETPAIRQVLERQRVDAAMDALKARLRQEHVKAEAAELLESLPTELFAEKLPRPRPLPSLRPPGLRKPEPTDDGLR
jgi:peptidyl-prolyl cis-trans isomerase C